MARRQSADPLERYWTHPWQTRALLAYCTMPRDTLVVEPCAGAGWMVDALAEHFGRWKIAAFDIQPARNDIERANTLDMNVFEDCDRIALITNPPFSKLAAYLRLGLQARSPFIALLGRITWLEPTQDREDCPDPDYVIVLPRVGFGGPYAKKSSDSATAAWFVWGCPERGVLRVRRSVVPRLKQVPATLPWAALLPAHPPA